MFGEVYKNKKVLITGETGFKGSWLATWLQILGAEVYGFSKNLPSGPCLFNLLNLKDSIDTQKGDINNYTEINNVINKIRPDFVFHLAAQAIVKQSYLNPLDTFQTNVMGTANILEALRNYSNKCIGIFITSDKCYHNTELGRPFLETDAFGGNDPYSASKGAAEIIIRSFHESFFKEHEHVRIASCRAGNVIGGGDWAPNRIVPDSIKSWVNGETVELRSPNAVRPWQHVLEPLSGYLLIGQDLYNDEKLAGEGFNFGPAIIDKYSVFDLVKEISKYWFSDSNKVLIEVSKSASFEEAKLLLLDSSKAFDLLNWSPVMDFETTVEFTAKWYRNFYYDKSDIRDFTVNQIHSYQSSLLNM